MQSPITNAGGSILSAVSARSTLATKLASHYLIADPVTPTDRELQMLNDYIDAEYKQMQCIVRYIASDIELPEAIDIWRKTKVLTVSIAHIEHPFLTAQANARFRAVHDWHHIRSGSDSSLSGEIESYKWARMTAPREIWWLLHSEIVLQAAACIATGEFQSQKLVRLF